MPTSHVRLHYRDELFVDLPVAIEPSGHRFYIFFHGLISLVDGPADELRAYALTMDENHRYRFGHWLVEEDLPSGLRGKLSGVSAAPKTKQNSLNPELNPTVRVEGWPNDADPRIRARLSLPRPRKIHYLGRGEVEVNRPDLSIYPTRMASGLKIFEYELTGAVDDLNIRSTDGQQLHWKGASGTEFSGAGVRVATLHVIDGPARMPDGDAHSVEEFALSMRVLGQPLLGFKRKPVDHPEQPPNPKGVSPFEVLSLAGRSKFLHKIADFARTARFSDSQALNGDPECKSCCSSGDGDWG